MLLLCAIRAVSINPAGASGPVYLWRRAAATPPTLPAPLTVKALRGLLDTGRATLLLSRADPGRWPAPVGSAFPAMDCLAGDLSLDALAEQ